MSYYTFIQKQQQTNKLLQEIMRTQILMLILFKHTESYIFT